MLRFKGKQVKILHGPAAVLVRHCNTATGLPGRLTVSMNLSQKTCLCEIPNSTVDRGYDNTKLIWFTDLLT
jgi:hypothetical protein